MMRFNSKHIIVLIMVLSLLLVSSSVVCAQDNNTTSNNNDIRNTIMDDKTIEYDNVTNINNNNYSHTVNFVDKKIDIMPMINNALLDNYENIPDFNYIGVYNGTNFELIIDHPINEKNNTYMMSLVYMFSNLTSANDIILKLQTHDYINNIMLTRTVHVNSVESYEHACTTPVTQSFSSDILTACFELFNGKNTHMMNHTIAMFSTTFGKTSLISQLKQYNVTFNYNVLFDDQYTFNKNIVWNLKGLEYNVVCIDGHGSTIFGSAGMKTEYTWVDIGDNILYVKNMTIKGFNNAIINRGFCKLDHVTLKDNKMKYTIDRDWGAGILNAGYCICNNCSFINNQASKGGAVFSQGEIYLNNCTFSDNTGYSSGANVFNVDKGKVFINGREIVLDKNNKTWNGLVTYDDSMSLIVADTLTGIATVIVSGAIGWLTNGMIIGGVAGGIVGGVAGFITSLFVNSGYYDINYNVKKHNTILIICCVVAGAVSGGICGYAHNYYKTHQSIVQNTAEIVNDISQENTELNELNMLEEETNPFKPVNLDDVQLTSDVEISDEKANELINSLIHDERMAFHDNQQLIGVKVFSVNEYGQYKLKCVYNMGSHQWSNAYTPGLKMPV